MDHYLDLKLLPDPEFSAELLRNALMQKLHRYLVVQRANDVALSFPEYAIKARTLGGVFRLCASATTLQSMAALGWLQGMRDHVQASAVQAIPASISHRRLVRVQPKTSAARLLRRQLKRKPEQSEALKIQYGAVRLPEVKEPFVMLKSTSTGEAFPLFLRLDAPQSQAVAGTFNAYGLSPSATIPWF